MAEEQPNGEKKEEVKLPETEDIPEKLRGKTATDIVKMYQEAEQKMHGATQEAANARKTVETLNQQLEELQESNKQTTKNEFDADNDEYITGESMQKFKNDLLREFNTALDKKDKEYQKKLKDVQQQTTSSTMAQIQRDRFIEDHTDLFDGKSQTEVDETIQSIVAFGLANNSQTLEGAFKKFQEFAQSKLGLTTTNPKGEIRRVPGITTGVQDDDKPAKSKLDIMKEFAQKDNLKLSSRLRPVGK